MSLFCGGSSRSRPRRFHPFSPWPSLLGAVVLGWASSFTSLSAATTGQIQNPGESHDYTFRLDRPERFYFDSLTPEPTMRWSLVGPLGALVTDRGFANSDGEAIGDTSIGLSLVPGDYRLRVDAAGEATPAYAFAWVNLADAPLLSLDSVTVADLAPANRTRLWQFTAAAGDEVRFTTLGQTNLAVVYARILDPQGNVVYSRYLPSAHAVGLVGTGTYTLLVEGSIRNAGDGTLGFTLERVGNQPPPPLAGTPFAFGERVEATLAASTTNTHTLRLTEPARVVFDSQTVRHDLLWSLTGPFGTVVSPRALRDADADRGDPVLTLPAGDYALRVTGSGAAAGDYAFRLLDAAAATPLILGTTEAWTVDPPTSTRLYQVEVTAGARLYFNTSSPTPGSTWWRLFGPFGHPVFAGYVSSDQGPLTLPMTGAYTLAIEGQIFASAPAQVAFEVRSVTDGTQALVLGALVTGTITEFGQRQHYTFTLDAPRQLYFDSWTNRTDIRWSLTGPTGTLINQWTLRDSDADRADSRLNLPPGTYTLTLSSAGEALGGYAFRLLDRESATEISLDTPVTGSLSPAYETRLLSFTIPAAGRYYFDSAGGSRWNLYWRLWDPFDRPIFAGYAPYDQGPLTLAWPGRYELFLEGSVFETGSDTYSFRIRPVNDGIETLDLNEEVRGAITHPGQVRRYRFSLSQAARVYLDSLAPRSEVTWALAGPTGMIDQGNLREVDADRALAVRSLAAGEYTLTLDAQNDLLPDYRFRLLDLALRAPIVRDTPTPVTLDPGNSTAVYGFEAAANTRVYVNLGGAGTRNGYWRLLDPYGNVVTGHSLTTDSAPTTLVQPGAYCLLLEGGMFQLEPQSFTVECVTVADGQSALTTGATVNGTITRPGQVQRYAFTLVAPQTFYFDSLTPSSRHTWSLSGPLGSIVSARYFHATDAAYTDTLYRLNPGAYELTVAAIGDHEGDFSFRWLPIAGATPILVDQTIAGTLNPGRVTDLYRFAANAGDRLVLDSVSGNASGMYWRVYDPYGRQLHVGGFASDSPVFTAAMTGEHLLCVEGGVPSSDAVNYSFRVVRQGHTPPAPLAGEPIGLGALVNGSAADVSATNAYRFTVAAPTRMVMDVLTNAGGFAWSLRGPDGVVADQVRFNQTDAIANPLPSWALRAGEYELTVTLGLGSYAFRLLDLSAGALFDLGVPVANTLSPATQLGLHRFTATAGQTLYFVGRPATGFSFTPIVSVFSPYGESLLNLGVSGSQTFVIPFTGAYALTVSSRVEDTSAQGDYGFTLSAVQASTQPLVLGQTIEGALTTPGQRVLYTFNLPQPTRLALDSLTNTDVHVTLKGPAGIVKPRTSLASLDWNSSPPFVDGPAGAYELIVDANGPTTAAYRLRVLDTANATSLTLGTELSAVFAPASSTVVAAFNAVTGNRLYFDVRDRTGFANAPWGVLVAPSGGVVAAGSTASDPGLLVMPETGRYLWFLAGHPGDPSPSASLTVRAVSVQDGSQDLALGATITGTLTTPGQRQLHRFQLPRPTRLHLDALASAETRWTLEGPGGVRVNALRFDGSDAGASVPWVEVPAGDFTLAIDLAGDATGSFSFRLLDLAAATPLTLNQPMRGELAPARSTATFQFAAQAGDAFYYDWSGPAGPSSPHLILASPSGVQVFRRGAPQDLDTFTLTENGTYTLLLIGRLEDNTATSRYEFTLRSVPPPPTFALLPSATAADLVVSDLTVDPPSDAPTGSPVTVAWKVTNAGAAPVGRSFTDRVTLRHRTTGTLLAQRLVFHDAATQGLLPPNADARHTATLTLPEGPGAAGPLELTVFADALNNVVEQNAAGTGEANNAATVFMTATLAPYPDLRGIGLSVTPPAPWAPGATLTLSWQTTNAGTRAAVGPWRDSLAVRNLTTQRLLLTAPSEDPGGNLAPGAGRLRQVQVALPATTDAYGQIRFDLAVDAENRVFEYHPDQDAETNNLSSLSALNESPALNLTLSTNRLVEGASLVATLRRRPATAQPLTVQIQSSDDRQLASPGAVTLPANIAELSFPVSAVDDNQVERTQNVALTATAAGYSPSAQPVTVLDNDVPQVTLRLAAATVSENAGPTATSATLTRDPVSNRPLTFALISANPDLARLPAFVTLPAGQATVTFPVAVLNNTLVDGARTVALGGTLLDAYTSQPVVDLAPVVLTVTDDDGATLSLRVGSAVVPEGRDPATTGTVTRNTAAAEPLTVTLTSSRPSEATVPPTVTLTAGQSSATFPVRSLNDGVTDGNQTVTLTATAPGYTAGHAALVVSDADLPDLVVTRISFATNAVTSGSLAVTFRVENRGFTPAAQAITQRVFLSTDRFAGGDSLAAQVSFNGTVPAGQFFDQTVNVRLPDDPGSFYLLVQTDTTEALTELLEDNNLLIAEQPVQVDPGYLALVQTDVTAQLTDTPVPLTGAATRAVSGEPAAFVPVTIHLEVRGLRRTLEGLTDAQGRFNAVFHPLPTEAGRYRIAASYPGLPMPAAQDEFSLLGLTVPPFGILRIPQGSSLTTTSRVENLSNIPLTGLAVAVLTNHPGVEVSASLAATTLPADGAVDLVFTATPRDPALLQSTVFLEVSSAEGTRAIVGVGVQQELLRPRLVAQPSRLDSPMVRGRQLALAFDLVNEGGVASGPIDVLAPPLPWLSVATPTPLNALAPGARTTVTVLLQPPTDLPLGDYQGTLAIGNANATLSLPYQFRAVSDARGDLHVTAEDEYTYFAEGNPRLADAQVVVRDALSGAPVATNLTDAAGLARFPNLVEAHYLVEVTAPNHNPFRQTALVAAGALTNVTAFLPRQTVTYTFTVVPTQIEDEYTIEVEQTFETQVPTPVIVLEPPFLDLSLYPQEEFQIDLTIRNQGLIAAENAALQFPSHPAIELTPLITDIGRIAPMSSITVPVLFKRLVPYASGGSAGRAKASVALAQREAGAAPSFVPLPCTIDAGMVWDYVCGPNRIANTRDWLIGHITQGCAIFDIIDRVFQRVPLPPPPYLTIDPFWTQQMLQLTAFSNFAPPPQFRLQCRPTRPTLARATDPAALREPAATLAGTSHTLPAPAASRAPLADTGEPPPKDVCAQVTLKLNQRAVLTRDAFQATLEINNTTPTPVENILVTLEVTRADGTDATALFGLRPPALAGLSSVDGTGAIAPQAIGSATWILVPSLDAAPVDGALLYRVGGTLSYSQDGQNLTVPLTPSPIQVHPQPELLVRYFHERDVFADDPFTPEVEPSVPYSLAVQVLNVGYGAARALRILGAQPQITENQKGLLIEFKTLGTQVENQPVSPALNVDFGQIDPGTNKLARWLFTSSVQGSFTNFNAAFQQTDPLGLQRLSLIRQVESHELLRIVDGNQALADHRPDLLTSEDSDPDHLPDTLFLSNGSTQTVHGVTATGISGAPSDTAPQVTLTANAPAGWTYFRLPNPAGKQPFTLSRVQRADGTDVPFGTNVWTTDRIFRGGDLRPIATNLVHLLDYNSAGVYTLHYAPAPQPPVDVTPPTSSVAALASQSAPSFAVNWSGTDDQSTVTFDIYVAIDATPAVRWLERTSLRGAVYTGQLGRRYAFYSVATDAAGNVETAPAEPDTFTTVALLNTPPTLTLGPDLALDEGDTLRLAPQAQDPDPGQTLRFTLLSGPNGMVLDPVTGALTWATAETDGPSTQAVRLRVTDTGVPALSATGLVNVVVREVNRPPTLEPIADRIVKEGAVLLLAGFATDLDLPAQPLRFALGPGAPAQATVDPVTGVLRWPLSFRDGPSTNRLTLEVRDNGLPPQTATRTFTVIVRDVGVEATVSISHTNLLRGATGRVPLTLQGDTDLTEIAFLLGTDGERLGEFALTQLDADVVSASVVPIRPDLYDLQFVLAGGASATTRTLAQLEFASLPAPDSALVPLLLDDLVGKAGDRDLLNTLALDGFVIVIAEAPVLLAHTGQPPSVVVFGQPGRTYALESTDRLDAAATWRPEGSVTLPADNTYAPFTVQPTDALRYYRARKP